MYSLILQEWSVCLLKYFKMTGERVSITPAEITDFFFTCKSEFKIQWYIDAYIGHGQR